MKRSLVAVLLALSLAVGMAGDASATQPLEPNPGTPNAVQSENCIAIFSSQVIHNGSVVRTQDRQAEIRALQEICNNAGPK